MLRLFWCIMYNQSILKLKKHTQMQKLKVANAVEICEVKKLHIKNLDVKITLFSYTSSFNLWCFDCTVRSSCHNHLVFKNLKVYKTNLFR